MTSKRFVILLIFLSLSAYLTEESRFDITSTSKCTKESAKGFCTEWNQVGQVLEQTAACFPAETKVMTMERGLVTMKELEVGEHILAHVPGCYAGKNCENYYAKVTGWLHR